MRFLSEASEVKFLSTAKTGTRAIHAALKVAVSAVVLTVGLSMATTVQAGIIYLDSGKMENSRSVNIDGIGNGIRAAPMQFKARYEDGRKVDLVAWCVDVYHSITVKDYNPDLKYRDDGSLTNDFSAMAKPLDSGDVLKVGLLTHYGFDVFNDKPVAPPAFVTPKPKRNQYAAGSVGTAAFNAATATYNSALSAHNTAVALYNIRVSTRNTRLSAVQGAIWQVMSNRNVFSNDATFDLLVDNLSGNHLTNYFAGGYGPQGHAITILNPVQLFGGRNGTTPLALTQSFAVAAVPEPATWAMMIIGFGAAGAVLRRRRQTGGVASA